MIRLPNKYNPVFKKDLDITNANVTDNTNKIGTLSSLQTTDKTNLVNAVNDNATNTNSRGLNVMRPPVPLVSAKGDGNTDDSDALQNLFNFARDNGYRAIIFEKKSYKLLKNIQLPDGVNIMGQGATLMRYYDKTVSYYTLKCMGNNIVTDLIIDGGSNRITVDTANQDFVNYCDIYITLADNVSITNCKFLKSCGSSISYGSSNNILIANNHFLDYLDHSIYGRTEGGAAKSSFVRIANNHFISTSATRQTIKIRNGVDNLVITNNTFNIPTGTFLSLDTGDSSNITNNNSQTSITGNNGNCSLFAQSSTNDSNYCEFMLIEGNNVICDKTIFNFYTQPILPNQNGANLRKVKVNDNIFSVPNSIYPPIILNGNVNGIGIVDFAFTNNEVHTNTKSWAFWLFGKIGNLIIDSNKFYSDNPTYDMYSNYLIKVHDNPLGSSFLVDVGGKIIFNNNMLLGNISPIFYENSTGTTFFKQDILLKDNTFNSGGNIKLVQSNATDITTITKKLGNIDNYEMTNKTISAGNWNATNTKTVTP